MLIIYIPKINKSNLIIFNLPAISYLIKIVYLASFRRGESSLENEALEYRLFLVKNLTHC